MSHPTGRRRRGWALAAALSGAAIGAMLFASSALGAGSAKPSMEVLPSTKGLKYQQTVEIKGHHLPKGSGTVAATICGLQDSTGKTIAKPGADDCAGAEAIGKLVQVKQWQSNGEFDTKYTLADERAKVREEQALLRQDASLRARRRRRQPGQARVLHLDGDSVLRSTAVRGEDNSDHQEEDDADHRSNE